LGCWDAEEAVCIAFGLIRKKNGKFEVAKLTKEKETAMDDPASLFKKPRTKIIWYKSQEKYAKKEVNVSDLAHQILSRKEEELDAMMKSYHKFKEAHSRFGSAMYPKPVKLGKKRSLPEDLICFGIKGSRLSHKDYQASAKSLGPLAAMKKIRFLQGKLQTPKKRKKGDHATRTLSSVEEAGIRTKLGRAVGTLKSMFINPNQKALVDVGAKTFMDDQICLSLLHSAKYIKPQSRTRYAAPAYCYIAYHRKNNAFPKGPEQQIVAWNEATPKFIDQGQCSAAVISLLDAVTEDLSLVNSILSSPILPRKDFGPIKKRVEGELVTNPIPAPTVNFYIPPLKGSATIQQGTVSGQEKNLPSYAEFKSHQG